MPNALAVFLIAALMCAAAALWGLRAYRRAGATRAAPALAACALVSLLALAIYLGAGRPDLPDAPYAVRLEALQQRDPTSYNAEEALAILGQAARDDPRDPLPHLYSGQLLLDRDRAEEAARAFDAALRRDPQLAQAMLGLGRALVRIDEGRVSAQALELFAQAGALGDDPAPWLYQAMAAMQAGRGEDARRLWGEALTRMAPDDPRRAMAGRMSGDSGR